jgi:hypothetical protein
MTSTNLAIIIAVSNYPNPVHNLPGCLTDAHWMAKLLSATNKYNEILCLDKDTKSNELKEELISFIEKYKTQKVDEVFFYYTGHGDFHDNEFYCLLSDFSASKRKQTSLSNSEVDNFLRLLGADLTVKIVDACHSGVAYIKDNNAIEKRLNESKQEFKKCYFMFSCFIDQSSYQRTFSEFTQSFINSVIRSDSNKTRYSHLMDYIADEFQKNSLQTPFFITQADHTETFCSLDASTKEELLKELESFSKSSDLDEEKSSRLEDFVKRDAEYYCNEEELLKALEEIQDFFINYTFSSDLTSLYKVTPEFLNSYNGLSNIYESRSITSIGNWLKENENNYFAEISYRRERITPFSANEKLLGTVGRLPSDPKIEYKSVVSGFDLTVVVPFKQILIQANPKYHNTDLHKCYIVFIFSKVDIKFFYFFSSFKSKNWDNYTPGISSEWQIVDSKIKDSTKLKESISDILKQFELSILEPIRARYRSN